MKEKYIYQTIMILKPNLNTELIKTETKQYSKLLQSWSTTKKIRVSDFSKKKLAYDIKGHSYGYYLVFAYQAGIENIGELERLLRKDDYVIKFITVKQCEDDLEPLCEQDIKPDAYDVLFGLTEYKR